MAQDDFGNPTSPLSGTDLIEDHIEPWRDALHSTHSGTARPSYVVAGLMWLDTTTTPWVLNMYDGANDVAIGTVNSSTHVFDPAGVIVNNAGASVAPINANDNTQGYTPGSLWIDTTHSITYIAVSVATGAAVWLRIFDLSSTLPVVNGGTGATTAAGARTNLGLGTSAVIDLDTDGTLTANSDTKIASQKATKTYVDAAVAAGGSGLVSLADISASSGTTLAYTGLPTGIKWIKGTLAGVSTVAGTDITVRLSSSATFIATGYSVDGESYGSDDSSSTGFKIANAGAASLHTGHIELTKVGASNLWVGSLIIYPNSSSTGVKMTGYIDLASGILDGIELITVNGIDTFDNGHFQVMYLK